MSENHDEITSMLIIVNSLSVTDYTELPQMRFYI